MRCNPYFAFVAFLAFGLCLSACSNGNGTDGTVVGSGENNYELSHGNLAPPMDSVVAADTSVSPKDIRPKDTTANAY